MNEKTKVKMTAFTYPTKSKVYRLQNKLEAKQKKATKPLFIVYCFWATMNDQAQSFMFANYSFNSQWS